jgi:hypothetical protein
MILMRRLMAPEVYDLATRLATLLVQHTASHIRSSCRHMLGVFLVHYPLSEKRMSQQLRFFVDNLSYVHESGRESSMEMLLYLFNKLPEDLLVDKAAYFFIPLVLRLVNDESPRLRAMAGALLTALLRRLPDASFNRLYSLTTGWYSNEVHSPSPHSSLCECMSQSWMEPHHHRQRLCRMRCRAMRLCCAVRPHRCWVCSWTRARMHSSRRRRCRSSSRSCWHHSCAPPRR